MYVVLFCDFSNPAYYDILAVFELQVALVGKVVKKRYLVSFLNTFS